MKEVSCRFFDPFLLELKHRGIAPARLVENLPLPLARLTDKDERIDWDDFRLVMENVSKLMTMDELVDLGASGMRAPVFRAFVSIGRLLYTTRDFYGWVASNNGASAMMITPLNWDIEDLGPTQLRATCRIRPPYRTCLQFFYVTKGGMAELPALLGTPRAQVEMQLLPDGAVYDVTYPPAGGALRWLRKVVMWPLEIRAAGRELKAAHETLQQRYFQLDATKQLVAAQATQLQTAHTISQVIHGNSDLDETMDSVARALTTIAGFTGVRLSLDGPSPRQAHNGRIEGAPQMVRAIVAHGVPLGQVELWHSADANPTERGDLADKVVPTVSLALHSSRSYAELLDAQEYLERRVDERTSELREARDKLSHTVSELEAAEKARTRLFANLNHEIRTPLTLILLTMEELRAKDGTSAELDRALAAVGRNARKLLRLVDGLLVLAAGDEARVPLSPERVDLERLVSDVIENFGPAARSVGVDLFAEVKAGTTAEVDESAIDRILSNLISNAIKFTPEGGEVRASATLRGDEVELAVRDTGIGISEAFLPRIFGRFEQDARPVRPGSVGSGLGLAIVRSLAEAHGGRAEVERLTRGTVFRVFLPRVARPELKRGSVSILRPRRSTPSDYGLPSGAPGEEPQRTAARDQTLLVVEDDPELRVRLAAILAPRFRVLEAPDAETALQLAEDQRPEILVSDVGLPGMDGLELTRRFRALPGNRLAPVVLLTAFATIENRLAGFEAGAIDYLTKPFDPNELVARVQAQLERRRVALQLHESEQLAAIGTMTAGLAHEMRNPANALVNAVGPLIELLPPELTKPGEPVAELLEVIRDCGAQIARLSRQLLGFQRGAAVARERVDATALVERALAILRPSLREIDLRESLRFNGGIWCAPSLMLQVLGNLLENAMHAVRGSTPPGQRGWIEVRTFQEGDRFVCEVSDSGPGVPVGLRERIFEPFFTTKPPGEGTGLGLSTSRQIATRHQGALFVHPSAGSSTFRLELPLSPNDTAGAVAAG